MRAYQHHVRDIGRTQAEAPYQAEKTKIKTRDSAPGSPYSQAQWLVRRELDRLAKESDKAADVIN